MNCKFFLINMLIFRAKMFHSEISIVRFKADRLLGGGFGRGIRREHLDAEVAETHRAMIAL
jgi:hypothetical protein